MVQINNNYWKIRHKHTLILDSFFPESLRILRLPCPHIPTWKVKLINNPQKSQKSLTYTFQQDFESLSIPVLFRPICKWHKNCSHLQLFDQQFRTELFVRMLLQRLWPPQLPRLLYPYPNCRFWYRQNPVQRSSSVPQHVLKIRNFIRKIRLILDDLISDKSRCLKIT